MNDYDIKSGNKRGFDTGAVRNDASGKGRFDLLPLRAIWDLAIHFEKGIEAGYAPRNWEQGIPLSCLFDSAMRHAFEFFMGVQDGEDHLIAAVWNLINLRETKRRIDSGLLPKELDDIPYTWKKDDTDRTIHTGKFINWNICTCDGLECTCGNGYRKDKTSE